MLVVDAVRGMVANRWLGCDARWASQVFVNEDSPNYLDPLVDEAIQQAERTITKPARLGLIMTSGL